MIPKIEMFDGSDPVFTKQETMKFVTDLVVEQNVKSENIQIIPHVNCTFLSLPKAAISGQAVLVGDPNMMEITIAPFRLYSFTVIWTE